VSEGVLLPSEAVGACGVREDGGVGRSGAKGGGAQGGAGAVRRRWGALAGALARWGRWALPGVGDAAPSRPERSHQPRRHSAAPVACPPGSAPQRDARGAPLGAAHMTQATGLRINLYHQGSQTAQKLRLGSSLHCVKCWQSPGKPGQGSTRRPPTAAGDPCSCVFLG